MHDLVQLLYNSADFTPKRKTNSFYKNKVKPMINEFRKILTDRITVKQEEKVKLVSKCPRVPQTNPQNDPQNLII